MPCYTHGMAKKVNRPKKTPGKMLARPLDGGRRDAPAQRMDRLYQLVREILAAARNDAWSLQNDGGRAQTRRTPSKHRQRPARHPVLIRRLQLSPE